jgi:hypothetical protein
MTDRLGDQTDFDPVFLVSVIDNVGYLRRGSGEVYEFRGIDPDVVKRLRGAEFLIVIEMDGDRVALAYDAPAGPLEYDQNDWAITKALTIFWRRLSRNRTGGAMPP